jgi:hypothetical protein
MKTIQIKKPDIISRMSGVAYGQHWLVVSAEGDPRVVWTSEPEKLPTTLTGDFVAAIPVGLYEDEQDEMARSIIDGDEERSWRYVTDTVESGTDVIQYTRMVYPADWNEVVETAVHQVADEWLELLNLPTADIGPWGFESSPDGDGYTPIAPPFQLTWEGIDN